MVPAEVVMAILVMAAMVLMCRIGLSIAATFHEEAAKIDAILAEVNEDHK